MPRPTLRLATEADLPAINSIYNYYVIHSTCTYQTDPATADERSAWFAAHGPQYPVTVAETDGEVIGWGSLSRFHPRAAYRPTVENSVYVRQDRLARGIGRLLLDDLIDRADELGYHSMIAGISADQEPSVKLHARAGFAKVGELREVGRKFERWLDVVYMQLILEPRHISGR
ncbi:MAG TPA: GNAT family N-acetyltransferase [Tepidisphaeraceae bacterium]|jgi:phosphinothricin acetyltransferase|nr:GNAT family N-acetyltransferase [Tepidisphaeraceae bacterium]